MEKSPASFVTTIDLSLAKKLQQDLADQGFELSQPPYTIFSGKKPGLTCTLYTSGKLMVQGKNKGEFIEFYLEPEILQSLIFTTPKKIDTHARSGVDESGKGDFFGPLCIATVYGKEEQFDQLAKLNVRDSKLIRDDEIIKLSKEIRESFQHHIVRINPLKYNELISKFKNLNHLLAWGHATAIENIVEQTKCSYVIIDQFADESVVLNALKRKGLQLNLTQRHKGEEDLIVAAASILARAAFLEGIEMLRKKWNIHFPKGASSQVISAGKKFVQQYGEEALKEVGKIHFKTTQSILLR